MAKLNLKQKMIAMNVGIVAILGALAFGFSYKLMKDEEELIRKQFTTSAESLNENIQDQYYERYGDIKAFALRFNDAKMSRDERIRYLNRYVELYGIYDLIMMVDLHGNLLAVNDKDVAGKDVNSKPLYEKNYSNETWFQNVVNKKYLEDTNKGFTEVAVDQPGFDSLVEQVYKDKSYGSGFSTVVRDEKGEPYAVITNRAGFRWVEDLFVRAYDVLEQKGFKTSEITLIDSKGTVISEYDPSSQKSKDVPHDKDILTKFNLVEKNVAAGVEALKKQSGNVDSIHARKNTEDIASFRAVEGKKITDALGWKVIVRAAKNEVLAEQSRMRGWLFGLLILVASSVGALGFLFSRRLAVTLGGMASRLQSAGNTVYTASSEISSSSTELSAAATEQAAALQETVAAVNEISSMVARTAEMAGQSKSCSLRSRSAASDGKKAVDEMISSIANIRTSNNEIMDQIEQGNRQISDIVKVISEIGNKTKVINEIVFQTKLLSFNASVEAARAGEHGKGFAVVAEEVGNLAQMSGNAAKEISEMLEGSLRKVQSIVDETRSRVEKLVVVGREKVTAGEDTARRCGNVLELILANTEEVNALISEIANSAQEQAKGVQEINSAMNELDSVTQQNSSVAQQAATSSNGLLNQSSDLAKLVAELMELVEGESRKIDALQAQVTFPGKEGSKLQVSRHAFKRKSQDPAKHSGADVHSGHDSSKNHGLKMASGDTLSAHNALPAADDPRFEDL